MGVLKLETNLLKPEHQEKHVTQVDPHERQNQ